MLKVKSLIMITLCIALAGIIGCNKLQTAQVSGTVTYKGNPLPDHQVSFILKDDTNRGLGATGITDANGKYTLSLPNSGTGCPVGSCRVTISWNAPEEAKDPVKGDKPPFSLPAKAIDGSLSFDVSPEGSSSANFDL